jgi:hypothetical protein
VLTYIKSLERSSTVTSEVETERFFEREMLREMTSEALFYDSIPISIRPDRLTSLNEMLIDGGRFVSTDDLAPDGTKPSSALIHNVFG